MTISVVGDPYCITKQEVYQLAVPLRSLAQLDNSLKD